MSPEANSSTGTNPITDHLDLWSSATQQKATVGRGKNSKVSPHGINKLRELILELAVRGKLVPQDPNDEPASVLLDKIAKEKALLIKAGEIKKPKDNGRFENHEKSFETPNGWIRVKLGVLFNSIASGGTPSKRNPSFWGGDIPWASVKDMGNSRYLSQTQDHITEAGLKAGSKLADISDILICTRMGLGKIAIVQSEMAFNQDLKAVKLTSNVNVEYFLNTYATLKIKGTGTTVSGIKQEQLINYVVGLPPLAEQHRIVAKVDELMALCDQLEQQQTDSLQAHQTLVRVFLDRMVDQANTSQPFHTELIDAFDTLFTTEESIDQLKQTILQLAVMGKLVSQDPNDEPASVLLEKIAAEKERLIKDKKIKKQKPLPPIRDEEKPFELPAGWEWVFLNPLITVMDAGWSPACPPEKSPADNVWGVLKTTAVQTMEYRQDENKVLSESKIPRPQYEVNPGDILITRAGPKNRVGISCLVEATRPNLMISEKIIRFHLVNVGMSERFISLCFNAGATADYLERSKSGMAESQMNISQDKLKSAPIPLCPIEEQHRIVAKVDELMTLCDTLKARLNEAQTTQAQLADAVVEQAVA